MRRAHRIFYDSQVWARTEWLGVRALKNPLDMWIYQEILHNTRPEVIVETGTYGEEAHSFWRRSATHLGLERSSPSTMTQFERTIRVTLGSRTWVDESRSTPK